MSKGTIPSYHNPQQLSVCYPMLRFPFYSFLDVLAFDGIMARCLDGPMYSTITHTHILTHARKLKFPHSPTIFLNSQFLLLWFRRCEPNPFFIFFPFIFVFYLLFFLFCCFFVEYVNDMKFVVNIQFIKYKRKVWYERDRERIKR